MNRRRARGSRNNTSFAGFQGLYRSLTGFVAESCLLRGAAFFHILRGFYRRNIDTSPLAIEETFLFALDHAPDERWSYQTGDRVHGVDLQSKVNVVS